MLSNAEACFLFSNTFDANVLTPEHDHPYQRGCVVVGRLFAMTLRSFLMRSDSIVLSLSASAVETWGDGRRGFRGGSPNRRLFVDHLVQ